MSARAWTSPEDLRGAALGPVFPGDRIRTDENFHPHYQVIALSGDRAWVRDEQDGSDHIVPIARCRSVPPRDGDGPI